MPEATTSTESSSMKKILSLFLFVAFLFIYVDPQRFSGEFIGLIEYEFMRDHGLDIFKQPPLLIVLLAQLSLLTGVIVKNKKAGNFLAETGIVALSMLTLIVMYINFFSNFKSLCTALPFLVLLFIYIKKYRKKPAKKV